MNPVSRWRQKRRLERELADEMAEHLAEKIEQLKDEGHAEAEAIAMARRQFGNLTLQREDSRAAWGWSAAEQAWGDLRFGCRVLAKTPAFTATAVIVMALGIGMNAAMFSAIKAVLLSALPYPEPERIVEMKQSAKDGHLMSVSHLDFLDWQKQNRSLQQMSAYGADVVTIAGNFPARRARMASVTSGFFDVMATQAAMGRTFGADEEKPGGTPTVVLGYSMARTIFGDAANAIGKTVQLNGMAFTVMGVMPPKFDFPDETQIWLPNDWFPDDSGRSAHNYRVIGRLNRGVEVDEAQADMNVVAARLAKAYVDDRDQGIRVIPLYDYLVGSVRPALWALLGAVTLVLLIACANVSNLQLARATARRKEMGMRSALGATRGRLMRQLLMESVLLSGAGGLLGLGLAELGVRAIRSAAPANIPRIANLGIDGGVLCFTAALSLIAGILFGMLPSFESSKADANDALKQGAGRGGAAGPKRWIETLVVGQIALAIVLLSGSGLLIKSTWKLAHVDTGLASGGVYVADITWPVAADGNSVDGAYVRKAGGQMLEQIKQLPGVAAAALINGLPMQGAPDGSFEIEGRPLPADPHLAPDADYRMMTPGYLKTFGIPILKGRGFTSADDSSNQQVAIVNQAFEKEFFPDGGSVGRRIRFLGFDRKPRFMTIVGVVPDMRTSRLNKPAQSEVYADYFQHADTRLDATLVVRGPASLQPAILRIVTALDQSTAVNFESMDSLIAGTMARERFETGLLAVFAACALVLSVIGVYGLLSYTVTQRTSEIGVRMALGASKTSITRLVLRQGGILVAVGVVVGVPAALFATRVLQSILYQMGTNDPGTLLAVVASFAAAALFGCYLPARRASGIDPTKALRTE